MDSECCWCGALEIVRAKGKIYHFITVKDVVFIIRYHAMSKSGTYNVSYLLQLSLLHHFKIQSQPIG